MLLSSILSLHYVRAVIPTAVLLGTSPTIILIHTGWRILSILLPKKWFYAVEDEIWGCYQKLVVFVFEACTGVEVMVKGTLPDKVENAVMICNHQSAMDWIVADFLALRHGMVGHMRFVFKDILKYFPLYGYVWGVHGGIFVRRDGTYNSRKMKSTLQMLMDREVPVYLVIFPEGTRFHPGKESLLAKSREYAAQNELEPLDQVLTPRVKAFHCALTSAERYLDAVYDATIIYQKRDEDDRKRKVAASMWEVLSGRCKRICIHFDRIPASEIPTGEGSQNSTFKWLHMRFKHKDDLLKKYYTMNGNNMSKNEFPHSLDDHQEEYASKFTLASPVKSTILSSLFLISTTAFLLSNPTGRIIYGGSILGGTIFGWVYAYLCF